MLTPAFLARFWMRSWKTRLVKIGLLDGQGACYVSGDYRNRRGGYSWNTSSLPDRFGPHLRQPLNHLARQAGHALITEPNGNRLIFQ